MERIEEIYKLVNDNGLEIVKESIEIENSGLDFQVAFATDINNSQWVIRLPRREDAFNKTKKEKLILDLVNENIKDFEAPNWEFYNEDFMAYKKLKGLPCGTINPEIQNYEWVLDIENIPDKYINSLGKAFANLHDINKSKVIEKEIKIYESYDIRKDLNSRMDIIKSEFAVSDFLWNRWQKWLNDDTYWKITTGFIHGETHAGHILIDENSFVTGFIDWSEAKYTDIANDFIFHYLAFGEEILDKLIKSYELAGGKIYKKMKEQVIELNSINPMLIGEFALESGLDEYIEMAKTSLQQNE